jgi:hypothetical protein
MGGVTNLGHHLRHYGPDLRLACLCDASAVPFVRSCLRRAGRTDVGWQVCDRDLEDELIRALGTAVVEEIIDSQGELRSLRRLARRPAQRDRPDRDVLRRFMGSRSHRKLRYAPLLVDALDLDRVPPALDAVLG